MIKPSTDTEPAAENRDKIILDLCGGTGSWSKPYKEAGYDVRLITLPEYAPMRRRLKMFMGFWLPRRAMNFQSQSIFTEKETIRIISKRGWRCALRAAGLYLRAGPGSGR